MFEPHPQVAEARQRLWALIEETPWLDWQLLTKRPRWIPSLVPPAWMASGGWPPNVWIGTSVGTQRAARERIPLLPSVPAPLRFLSCEPLVEPVSLTPFLKTGGLAWVICGGYSGDLDDWPLELTWARTLRDECRAHGVAFFMKQLGSVYARTHRLKDKKGENPGEFPEDLRVQQFPVSPAAAGRVPAGGTTRIAERTLHA